MKEFYEKEMLSIKIIIQIQLIQEVIVRGNGNIFFPLSGKKLKEENDDEKCGRGLIIKEYGRIWKVKRHSLKGYRKLNDGVYSRNGKIFYKLL